MWYLITLVKSLCEAIIYVLFCTNYGPTQSRIYRYIRDAWLDGTTHSGPAITQPTPILPRFYNLYCFLIKILTTARKRYIDGRALPTNRLEVTCFIIMIRIQCTFCFICKDYTMLSSIFIL